MKQHVLDSTGRVKVITAVGAGRSGLIGSTTVTSDTSQSITTGAVGAAHLSLPVTGDGLTRMLIEASGFGPYFSAGTISAASAMQTLLCDGGPSVATAIARWQHFGVGATGIAVGGYRIRAIVAPFSGAKTFNVAMMNPQAGTCTLVNQAGASYPSVLTAMWLPNQ